MAQPRLATPPPATARNTAAGRAMPPIAASAGSEAAATPGGPSGGLGRVLWAATRALPLTMRRGTNGRYPALFHYGRLCCARRHIRSYSTGESDAGPSDVPQGDHRLHPMSVPEDPFRSPRKASWMATALLRISVGNRTVGHLCQSTNRSPRPHAARCSMGIMTSSARLEKAVSTIDRQGHR